MLFGACGAGVGKSRFGNVFLVRWSAKFTGSAGSRIVFDTTRNCRNAEFAPGVMPKEASSAVVVATKAGELVKTSTTVPPPTLSTAEVKRGTAATSTVPWIAPSD